MKINSFFCGAGGFDLGFIQAGFEIVGAYDFDKYAIESYNHNIGGGVQSDVRQLKGEHLSASNGWLFGFPCQDISIAGKQTGETLKDKPRSGMFYEIMRLLGEVEEKPEWILAENVKAVKKLLPEIESEYDKAGYTLVTPQLYNSKYWGVPQNRERYFLLGIRKDLDLTFIFPSQQTDFIPKLRDVLEEQVDEKYYIDDLKATKIIEAAMEGLRVKQATKLGYDIAVEGDSINISHPNSTTRRGRVGKQVAQTLLTGTEQVVVEPQIIASRGRYNVDGKVEQNYELNKEGISNTLTSVEKDNYVAEPKIEMIGLLDMKGNEVVRRVYDPEGLAPTLTTSEGGHRQPKILTIGNTNPSGRGMNGNVFDSDGLAPTLTTNKGEGIKVTVSYNHKDGIEREIDVAGTLTSSDWRGLNQNQSKAAVVELPQFRVRKLTPREYARLQGFPDSYEQIVSNSQFYKQMGNAVTVNVAHAIALAIKEQFGSESL